MKCKVCNKDDKEIKFIKKDTFIGTSCPNPKELFRGNEWAYGTDYYSYYDLRKITCVCGYVSYEKIED